MKKIILFVSAFALLLTSCSSDDSDPEPAAPTGTLLTKIIETYDDGSIETSNITYNGNKIVSMITVEYNEKTIFTYTGDLITKEEFFVDDIIDETFVYEYDTNQRLIKSTKTYISSMEVDNFTYNSNNTVSFVTTSAGNTIASGTIYFDGNQPYKKELSEISGTSVYNTTEEDIYDDKVNPFSSVVGFSKIQIACPSYIRGYNGIPNNSIEFKRNGVTDWTSVYTYNSNNMPATEVYTEINHPDYNSTLQYIYN